jgi:hypothetical protein
VDSDQASSTQAIQKDYMQLTTPKNEFIDYYYRFNYADSVSAM